MTPLQTAAQELLDKYAINSTAIPVYMFGKLRKALEAEQAQAVEPSMRLSEILAGKGVKLRTEFEEKPREHVPDAGKTTGARAAEPDAIGCKCSVCGGWQRWTPSGMVCSQGHGGAPGVNTRLFTRPAPPPADGFDTWAKNPYTIALQKSIAEDYVPKQAQQVAVPDGYALVPIEPTEEMIVAGQDLVVHDTAYEDYRGVYKAMLAAAQGDKE